MRGKRWTSLVEQFRSEGRVPAAGSVEELLDNIEMIRNYEMIYGPALVVNEVMRNYFNIRRPTNTPALVEAISFKKWMDE